jgi:hypothetical protein
MKKLILTSACSISFLTACGGGSNGVDNTAPTIDPISDINLEADTISNGIVINARDNRSTSENLLIGASSSNTQVVSDSNLQLSGTGNTTQLIITPNADTTGTSTITVEATDEAGNTSTSTFVINVTTREEDQFNLVDRITQLTPDDDPEFINQVSLVGEIDEVSGFDAIVDNN